MRSKLIIFLLIAITSVSVQAQVTYAKPEEFKTIKNRTLIVELLEVDQRQIDEWEKKKGKLKEKKPTEAKKYAIMVDDYKSFVQDYNTFIKSAVEKNWDFNETVEFKTTSQVNRLRKNSSRYTILWFSETTTSTTNAYGFNYTPNLSIPTLNYSRIEKGKIKVDYSFYMPYTGLRKKNVIKESDLLLSLKLMRNHILEIEKSGKKKFTFKNYSKNQASVNCKKLADKKIALNEVDVHKKATFSEISSAYKNGSIVKLTDEETISAIENNEDVIIGMCIPHTIVAGSVGPLSTARILFLKSFVNVSTGTIYTCYGTVTGEFNDPYYRVKEFTKYGNCK